MSEEQVPVVFDVTLRRNVEFDVTLCLSAEVGVTLCRQVEFDVSHFQGPPVVVGSGGAAFELGGPRRRRRS